ncbi:MAG TPA: nitrous oxide reductase family maturation protein NosD [Candidatus Sulfomarinibacteraceae bacterium]|nr:nitrous oxide reductase family maturation protein NosD [Candidatus Sulfomarinibacteraceae bacterium]
MRKQHWRWLPALLLILAIAMTSAQATTAKESGQQTITAEQLPQAIAAAQAGDVIMVEGGTYFGSLEIDRPLTLIGHQWPIVDGQNQGTVLKLTAPDVTIQGFVVRKSGDSLDQENSGIAVEAPGAIISGNRFEDTLFGVYLRRADNSTIENNVIHSKDLAVPRRGDAIRVWYSNDVIISNNIVEKGRDVVLWYSERLTVRGNDVSSGRYGLHFMYCDDALIEDNRLLDNSVGAFLMYSRRMTMQNNTIAANRGPSGYGIGLKDMDDAVVLNNMFIDNRVGAYLDGSPREVDSIGLFQGNVFAYNDIGIELLPAVRHNEFIANSFVENEEQVALAGGGRPGANAWTVNGVGNFWSNYAGFDADGDGRGDIPYTSQRLFEDLMQREPALRLFLYSPATEALDFAARAFPVVRPQPKLEDSHPLMAPVVPASAPPLPAPDNQGQWLWAAVALLALSLGLGVLPAIPARLRRRRYSLQPSMSPGNTL